MLLPSAVQPQRGEDGLSAVCSHNGAIAGGNKQTSWVYFRGSLVGYVPTTIIPM